MTRAGGEVAWKNIEADWREVLMVCRRCAKKLDGGFGSDGDQSLCKALRRSLDDVQGRKTKALRRDVAVVEVDCLDICPKKAVVVVKGSDPRRLILVPKGAGMGDLIARLALPAGSGSADPAPVRLAPLKDARSGD